jgi:hypothetical protein
MKIIPGSGSVPVIYTAHHASHDFGEFDSRCALSADQKVRFSDYGSDLTVPNNGIVTIVAERSRALGDLNRNPDDPGRFQLQDYGQPTRHNIWKSGQELTEEDKAFCQANYYDTFHNQIIEQLRQRDKPTFVIAWDNTAHYKIGDYTNGKHQMMRPFILSNRGAESSAESINDEITSCDPIFLKLLSYHFVPELRQRNLPTEVMLNFVMHGGYICRRYNTRRNESDLRALGVKTEVQSLQLEYDTIITHDQDTLQPKTDRIIAVQEAFSAAIIKTIQQYLAGH